ncbi:MAG: hypothetical protein JWR32_1623 [Mycobacterium sp.]|jgi:hypothetical protein|nr:hypothetical protein [Mycobacterium sp.]
MTKHVEGKAIMRIRINYVTPVLAAGAAAVAIAASPSASATPDRQPCSDMGGSTQCQSAGNVQIYTTLHAMPVTPRTAYGPFEGYHAGHN